MPNAQALAALREGRWHEAHQLLQREAAKTPHDPLVQHAFAVACLQLGLYGSACLAAEQALQRRPNCNQAQTALAAAHAGLGEEAFLAKQWAKAVESYRQATELLPDVGEWHSNHAVALQRLGDLEAAQSAAKLALQLLPNHPEAHNTMGTVLQELEQLDSAGHHYKTALSLDPNHNQARSNYGTLLHMRGELADATASFQDHLRLFPDDVRTKVNLAGSLLLSGAFKDGWQLYEARLEQASGIMSVPANLPRWEGPEYLCQELVLIHEQGYGDGFQFLRYAPLLRPYANRLIFQGPSKLHELVMQSGLVDACTPEQHTWTTDEQVSRCWEALLSIPYRLGATPAQPLTATPYLKAHPKRIAHWQRKLADKSPLIALHWQGNPEHEVTISRGRSLPLEAFAQVAAVRGIRLISLQKGPGSEQLAACSFAKRFDARQPLVDATWDFAETAAILQCCDLVISNDSGLVHLAAGLGRPTWILLMQIPEWRWGLTGEHTPWYPTARLWRQRERGDWEEVVGRLATELERWRNSYTGANA